MAAVPRGKTTESPNRQVYREFKVRISVGSIVALLLPRIHGSTPLFGGRTMKRSLSTLNVLMVCFFQSDQNDRSLRKIRNVGENVFICFLLAFTFSFLFSTFKGGLS